MAYFLQGLFGTDNNDTLSKIKSFVDDLTIPKGKYKSNYQRLQVQKFGSEMMTDVVSYVWGRYVCEYFLASGI
jgi:diphthamide synthase (EF-2-diphthine--ammonia ligase)